MDDDMDHVRKDWDSFNYSFTAHDKFNKFIDATESGTDIIEICQDIYSLIDKIVLGDYKEQFIEIIPKGKKVYRARILNHEDDGKVDMGIGKTRDGKYHGYNDFYSREPIIGIAGEGRNNIEGSSYLYVASDEPTACMEIKPLLTEFISLAEFEINKDLNVINFSDNKQFNTETYKVYGINICEFVSRLMLRFSEPVDGSNAYKATQLISDYIRKTGVDGIAYNSFLSPGGINYTIFNCHHKYIKFNNSKLLIHKQAIHSFWDLNDDKAILSNPDGKLIEYDLKIAEKHKKSLNTRLRYIEK